MMSLSDSSVTQSLNPRNVDEVSKGMPDPAVSSGVVVSPTAVPAEFKERTPALCGDLPPVPAICGDLPPVPVVCGDLPPVPAVFGDLPPVPAVFGDLPPNPMEFGDLPPNPAVFGDLPPGGGVRVEDVEGPGDCRLRCGGE